MTMSCCECLVKGMCPYYWFAGPKCDAMKANAMMDAEHGPCEKFNQK